MISHDFAHGTIPQKIQQVNKFAVAKTHVRDAKRGAEAWRINRW